MLSLVIVNDEKRRDFSRKFTEHQMQTENATNGLIEMQQKFSLI